MAIPSSCFFLMCFSNFSRILKLSHNFLAALVLEFFVLCILGGTKTCPCSHFYGIWLPAKSHFKNSPLVSWDITQSWIFNIMKVTKTYLLYISAYLSYNGRCHPTTQLFFRKNFFCIFLMWDASNDTNIHFHYYFSFMLWH